LNESALLIATTNKGKKREIERGLSDLLPRILSLSDLGITAPYAETGTTFLENAKGKSLFYTQFWDGLTLAEDSGLEVAYLNGAPGVISARFSGPQATDRQNNDKLLRLLDGVPGEKRSARFVSSMVLSQKQKWIFEARGEVEGFIAPSCVGESGFGYDPLFFYPPFQKTFGELLPQEKNRVSHRGRALQKMRTFLEENLGAGP
jgi:XTP/dITP diphosphohydrolase